MKKKLAILLALLLVFPMILSACGNQQKDERDQLGTRPVETIAPAKKETTALAEEETTAPTEAETTAPAEEETNAPTEEEATAPGEETKAPTEEPVGSAITGQVEGNVYTNQYLGFGLELDDSWRFYSEAELQAVYGKTKEMMTGTEAGSSIEEGQQFMDMIAESSEAMATINLGYERPGMQEWLIIQGLDEEKLLDTILLTTKDVLMRSYEQVGIEVESMEKVEVPFLGETGYGLKTVASVQGVPYYILQFFLLGQDKYLATLTFNCFQEDITEDMVALCYRLD